LKTEFLSTFFYIRFIDTPSPLGSWYSIHKWKAVSHFGNMLNLTAMVSYFLFTFHSQIPNVRTLQRYDRGLVVAYFLAKSFQRTGCRLAAYLFLVSLSKFFTRRHRV
jgi:hypothetical protein